MILLKSRLQNYRTSAVKCDMRVMLNGWWRAESLTLLRKLGDYFTEDVQLVSCFAGSSLADSTWGYCRQLKLLIQVHRCRREQHGWNAGKVKWVAVRDEAVGRTIMKNMAGHIKKALLVTLSMYFGLSVFQLVQLKQYKLGMFQDWWN